MTALLSEPGLSVAIAVAKRLLRDFLSWQAQCYGRVYGGICPERLPGEINLQISPEDRQTFAEVDVYRDARWQPWRAEQRR